MAHKTNAQDNGNYTDIVLLHYNIRLDDNLFFLSFLVSPFARMKSV